VTADELLNIGAFAVATGLSIPALRHYDEIGLLKPAEVDAGTGYRRYGRDQLDRARLICGLRTVSAVDEFIEKGTTIPAPQSVRPVQLWLRVTDVAEVHPPMDFPYKPRSSCVRDPSGNHVDLTQA